MSFMQNTNDGGPRTDPWRIPGLIFFLSGDLNDYYLSCAMSDQVTNQQIDIKLILQFVTSGNYICYLCSFSFAPPDQILQHSIQSHQCNQKFSIRKRKLDSCIGQFVYTSTHFLLHLNDLRQRLTSGSNPNIKEGKLSFNRKCSSPLSLP